MLTAPVALRRCWVGNLLSGRALRGANAAEEPRQAAATMIARTRIVRRRVRGGMVAE